MSSGSIEDYSHYEKYLGESPYIICADGGAGHAKSLGVKPDLLVGDFDSISVQDLDYYKEIGTEILKYPVEKDMTDTQLAVETAIQKGFEEVVLIGALGTRFDHSLSNIFLLKKLLDAGVKGKIVNEHNEITLISDRIRLQRESGTKVTLLPLSGEVHGVTTSGLYYPLEDADIMLGSSWGVSNEFTSEIAEVTVKSGLLLVIMARD